MRKLKDFYYVRRTTLKCNRFERHNHLPSLTNSNWLLSFDGKTPLTVKERTRQTTLFGNLFRSDADNTCLLVMWNVSSFADAQLHGSQTTVGQQLSLYSQQIHNHMNILWMVIVENGGNYRYRPMYLKLFKRNRFKCWNLPSLPSQLVFHLYL